MKNLKLIFVTTLLMVIFCFKANAQVAITNDAGFTTPQSILHIYRNADGSLLQLSNPTTTNAANRGLYFTATGNNFSLINNEAGSLSFHTTNLQRAIILSTGQFGINMTPTMQLDVTSATTTAGESAIRGISTGNAAVYGVQGTISSTTLNAAGVYGYASGNAQVFGVYGSLPASNTTGNAAGVRGYVPASTGNVYGVFGESAATGASSAAVRGYATGAGGTGVYGQSTGAGTSYAIRGTSTGAGTTNYAGYFSATNATNNYAIIVPSGGGSVGIGTTTPNASALLDVTSTTKGILIPRVALTANNAAAPITAPVDALLIYNTATAGVAPNSVVPGYYFWNTASLTWKMLYSGTVPSIPGNVEYWIRPAAASYIRPEFNSFIRVYDAAQTYGLWYDGASNQYAIWARTSSASSPTAAVTGFSDVAGNQTSGYLGYNGNYTAPAPGTLSVDGSGVYGMVDDPSRAAIFGRTTGASSVAAIIGYSNVWIPGFFEGDDISAVYAGRPAVVGNMICNASKGDIQDAVEGYSQYTGAGNLGYTYGGFFQGIGGTQDSYGVGGYATSNALAVGGDFQGNRYGTTMSITNETTPGTGYTYGTTYATILSLAEANVATQNMYHFAIHGVLNDYGVGWARRSGAVLGYDNISARWGCLGYTNSASIGYAVYGTVAMGVGAGKSLSTSSAGIGLGIYSGVLGGGIRGNMYGLNVSGERYSLYLHGKQFTNDIITILSDVSGNTERVPTYVPASMTVDVYTKGTATIVNGEANITFDNSFRDITSDTDPVIVTVTPIGRSANLYIDNTSKGGFKIIDASPAELKSQPLSFTWIAIGTRKGYENPQNPPELLSKTYESNMGGVMFNENDLQNSALPMWWDGSTLRFDAFPEGLNPKQNERIVRKIPVNRAKQFSIHKTEPYSSIQSEDNNK